MLENIENVVITKSHVLEVQLEIATNEEKNLTVLPELAS